MVQTRRSLLTTQATTSSVVPTRLNAEANSTTEVSEREENDCPKKKKSRNSKPRSLKNDVKPLLGREREFSTICEWIKESMADEHPLSIYISGSPGTGKSATVKLIQEHFNNQVISASLNCASVHSQNELIKSILKVLGISARPSLAALVAELKGLRKHFLLVLDEIDHLVSKTNSFLYTAFQWPHSITSKLIVIGISNSIDLTERLLPKLKLTNVPKTLVFAPYSKEEITEILKAKMSAESDISMDAKAVELCSRKVAAMSGDLRTALHVIKQTRNFNEPSTPRGCREILGVLNGVYSSPLARARLPLQPRLILAVALSMSSSKKNVLTMNSLTNAYSRACDIVKVPRLEGDDFAAAMQILESQSFIMECGGGKLILKVDADTAKSAIADSAMIAQISEISL